MPSVSLVSPGFERQALATGRGLGFDGMRLAVLDAHPDGLTADELVGGFVAHTVAQVVAGLTVENPVEAATSSEPTALDVVNGR